MQVFNAASAGDCQVLKKLLTNNALKDAKHPKTNQTPLHVAASQGQLDAVVLLLTHDAPHDATDRDGSLPLHLAAEAGHVTVLQELIKGPRKLSLRKLRTSDGSTPLHSAVSGGHVEAVVFLVEAGSRVETKDKAGRSCLDLAIALGNEEVVAALSAAAVEKEPISSPQVKPPSASVTPRPTSAAPPRPSTASRAPPPANGAKVSPASTATAAAAAKSEEAGRLLELLKDSVAAMKVEIASLKENQEKERAAASSEKLELTTRIAELETRLLSSEERSKDGRARIERVEEGLREVQSKSTLIPQLQETIKTLKDGVRECDEGVSKLWAHLRTVETRVDAMVLARQEDAARPSSHRGASDQEIEARLRPLSSELKTLTDKVGEIQAKQLEVRQKVDKMESAPPVKTLPPSPLQLNEDALVMSPAPSSSVRRHASVSSSAFGGEPPTTPSAGQGFVSRQEFENTLKRVEERAREAVEKEASAKKMSAMARTEEEHWGSWRAQREDKERVMMQKVHVVEVEIESIKLNVGALDGKVGDLSDMVLASPSTRRAIG